MFGAKEWKMIYNDVFSVFPSPDNIPMKITLRTKAGIKTFNSSAELITFLCFNKDVTVTSENIDYNLEDASLRSEVEREIHKLDDKIKERF